MINVNINSIAKVLQSIGETSGRKEKIRIIKESVHIDGFTDIVHFIYNPYLKTNIAKKKLSKKVTSGEYVIQSIQDYMDFLALICTGKDSDIYSVQQFIKSQPEDVHWLLEAMAIKTLKIGVTGTTINEALGYQLVPQFDVMLAEPYIKKTSSGKEVKNYERFKGKDVIITKKLDGNRAAIFVRENGDIDIYSREGHKLEGFVEIEHAFKDFQKGVVYDGEMIAINFGDFNALDLFQITSSIIKKKGEKLGLEFHVFDSLPIEDFERGHFEASANVRKDFARKQVELLDNPLVKYVEPLFVGEFDEKIVEELSEQAFANEEEGIMIQLKDAPYECKRTKNIQKVKSIKSCDILCVDVYKGKTGENIGRLGGVVAEFKGSRINVGSGFKSDERDSFWKDKSLIVGKIIEVMYTDEWINEDGELDLRFARFKTVRDDKTEPSYN